MSIRDLNLNCRRAAELLSAGRERELTGTERAGLCMHLVLCAGCRHFKRHLSVMREAMRKGEDNLREKLEEARLSPAARRRIEEVLRSEQSG